MLLPTLLSAQKIKADIQINTDVLDAAPKQAISFLPDAIKWYIESQKWVRTDIEETFNISLSIHIKGFTESGYQNLYTAQVVLTNGVDQRYFDTSWQFPYNFGQQLSRSSSYNALTSFLDYWVLFILGNDLDTWQQFGGNTAFADAQQIASVANSVSGKNWEKRFDNINQMMQLSDYRKLRFSYYEAIYLWDAGNEKDAKLQVDAFMRSLELSLKNRYSKIYTRSFMESKHVEFVDILYEMERKVDLKKLIKIDEERGDYYKNRLSNF